MPNTTTQSPFTDNTQRQIHVQRQEAMLARAYGVGASGLSHRFNQAVSAAGGAGASMTMPSEELEELRRAHTTPPIAPTIPRPTWGEPPAPQEPQELPAPIQHIHLEGNSSLIAEVERCYNILSRFPAPSDRSEDQQAELMYMLTEEIAYISEDREPLNSRSRNRGLFF